MLAALLLTAAGSLTAIEVISAGAGRPARVFPYGWVNDTAWDDWHALAMFGAMTTLGLLFTLTALLPGKTRIVPLRGCEPSLVMGVCRRGLKKTVAAAAQEAPGVSRVRRVRLRRRRVKLVAETAVNAPEGLDEGVAEAVRDRLGGLRPLPVRSVSVRVRRRDR